MLKIDLSKIGPIEEISLTGKLEITTAKRFDIVFKDVTERNPAAVGINLENLRYIDSSGISSLLRASNIASKSKIRFGCYGATAETQSIFNLSQVSSHINLTTKSEFYITG